MPPSPDDLLAQANDALEAASPALFRSLSPLGRRALFPPDIPFQAAQAREKAFNATIGQITDGAGRPLPLPSMAAALEGLSENLRDAAFLYSPMAGLPALRQAWRGWQRRSLGADGPASTLPVVTVGLTHGLSLVADLFGGEGRVVAAPTPFWGNYRQAFALRTGARMVSAPAYRDGRFHPEALAEAIGGAGLEADEPAVAILNLPSNPGGYSPTPEERGRIAASLLAVAADRPLVVVCDDAYAGLVYGEGIPVGSMFWDLAGRHPNLVPIKVDGATKELSFFGGRVGFLTFAFDPESDSAAARALESKVTCLVRSTLGSPVAVGQAVVLHGLSEPQRAAAEVEAVRRVLAGRWRVLTEALEGVDRELLVPLPSNSGCFSLIELGPRVLAAEVDAEAVRRHLLEHEDTGLVSIAGRFVRIAFCSVAEEALPEVVRRLERGVGELVASRSAGSGGGVSP